MTPSPPTIRTAPIISPRRARARSRSARRSFTCQALAGSTGGRRKGGGHAVEVGTDTFDLRRLARIPVAIVGASERFPWLGLRRRFVRGRPFADHPHGERR